MRKYEVMLILPADADDKVVDTATGRIAQVIGANGGEIQNVDRWGKRRLAFEIDKHTDGYYVVVDCTADPTAIRELGRVLSLADEVIRYKTVVREDRAA